MLACSRTDKHTCPTKTMRFYHAHNNNMKNNFQRVLLMRMRSQLIKNVKHPHHVYPPLTLKYMEALLRQEGGYEVKLIDTWLGSPTIDELVREAHDWQPDVVIIMANPVDSQTAFEFGRALKQQHTFFLTAVGQEVAMHLERFWEANSPFDVALPGESEMEALNMMTLLNAKGAAAVKEKYHPSTGLTPFVAEDLNKLPFPTYTPEEIEQYCFSAYPLRMKKNAKWGFILSSRGCPYNCFFCSPVMRKTTGEKVRVRSVANVVDEIEHLMRLGVNVISFEDDDLTAKKGHIQGLCDEIRARNITVSWICHARVDEVTPELMNAMKDAGCILIRFGVESANERILQLLNKNPRKKDWRKICNEAFHEARRLGIATNALIIIGNPDETAEEIENTINFVVELNPDMVQVHFFTVYPGSPAYEVYKSRVPEDQVAKLHHYNLPIVNLSKLSEQELWKLRSHFYKRFFMRPAFVFSHILHYSLFYLTNPKVFHQLWNVTGIL